MSVFGFFKKELENTFFFEACDHNAHKIKKYFWKNVVIFFDIFLPMDNKKGKKGKLFFANYFVIEYNVNLYFRSNKIVTVMVMDNGKG